MTLSQLTALEKAYHRAQARVKQLKAAASLGLEFVDHWVGDHSMDDYEATPRVTADIIRVALTGGDTDDHG